MKKLLSLTLVFLLIASSLCIPSWAVDEVYATVVSASDFQGSSSDAVERFGRIINVAKKDGINADGALFGGDYSSGDDKIPERTTLKISNKLTETFPNFNVKNAIYIQGNHDFSGNSLAKTGMHDLGAYLVYAMNEDDYFKSQYSLEYGEQGIKKCANDLKLALDKLLAKNETRPVFVLTHVPLHHSSRSSYGDNLYSKYVFDVLNSAAVKLDIIYLFGHNHSSGYDNYIGGAVNYIEKNSYIRIPVPSNDARGENGYTNELLNFTYMNCGYVGYSSNSSSNGSTKTLTASFFRLSNGNIDVVRYSETGKYSTNSISRINKLGNGKTTVENTDKPLKEYPADIYSSGISQLKANKNYIIASSKSAGQVEVAKAETQLTGKKYYEGLRTEGLIIESNDESSSVITSNASIIYTAEKIDGNIYLKSVDNGKYLSVEEYEPDNTYTSGRRNIEFITKDKLDDSSVCSIEDGHLKIGDYYIHNSGEHYWYAKASADDEVLFESSITLPEPNPIVCDHLCHSSGITGIIWRLILPIIRIFGIMPVCKCGTKHY